MLTTTRTRGLWMTVVLLCSLGCSGAGFAQTKPAADRFLVATRDQQGFFAHTVILLIEYNPNGAFGLIVNRPTTLALSQLLPDVNELQGRSELLYVGGPVSPDHLIMLIRSKAAPPDAIHVMGDIYASGSMKALRAAAGKAPASASFRGYAGYAGWGPGQLDAELAKGAWLVVPATAQDVFTRHPENLWRRLISRESVEVVRLASWSQAQPLAIMRGSTSRR